MRSRSLVPWVALAVVTVTALVTAAAVDRTVDPPAAPEANERWAHTAAAWRNAVLALIVLTMVPLFATGLALRRYDPQRR